MKSILFCGLMLACSVGNVLAQDDFGPVNTGAANFLTIQSNARNAGMGGVGVALESDNDAVFYNGATVLTDDVQIGGVTYTFAPWMRDFESGYSLNTLGGFYKIDKQNALFAGFRYFNYPSYSVFDGSNAPVMKVRPKEWAIDVGYARELFPSFILSGTFRYIHSDLGTLADARKADAVAFDFGAVYKRGISKMQDANWMVGLQISNIGSKLKYLNTKEKLPALAKLGGSLTLPFSPYHKLIVATDFGYRFTPSSFQLSAGAEYTLVEHFKFRGGYRYGDKKKGDASYATVGAGLYYRGAALDFSWLFAGSQEPINNTFWMSFSFSY